MSKEAVLLQWERKIEVAERLEDDSAEVAEPVALRSNGVPGGRFERSDAESTGRFDRETPEPTARFDRDDAEPTRRVKRSAPEPTAAAEPGRAPIAERRTITITGRPASDQPAAARRRRSPVLDAQLAQPDRIALWAFLLGLLLVAVAAGTAHA